MPNFNKVYLMGNLTRDPELRTTPSGTPVANSAWQLTGFITIPTASDRGNDLRRYRGLGTPGRDDFEVCEQGNPLFVEGRLKLDTWENKEGEKRKMKIMLENMQLISQRGEGGSQATPFQSSRLVRSVPEERRHRGRRPF